MLRKILLAAAAVPIAALGVQWGATANAAVRPKPLTCSVVVSNQHPADGSAVAVAVRVASNARVTVTALYKTTRTSAIAVSNEGLALVAYGIGTAKPGYRVLVDASVSLPGYAGSCTSWFIPQTH